MVELADLRDIDAPVYLGLPDCAVYSSFNVYRQDYRPVATFTIPPLRHSRILDSGSLPEFSSRSVLSGESRWLDTSEKPAHGICLRGCGCSTVFLPLSDFTRGSAGSVDGSPGVGPSNCASNRHLQDNRCSGRAYRFCGLLRIPERDGPGPLWMTTQTLSQ
jgi:hypothetical protein